jgi:hypothetical protein
MAIKKIKPMAEKIIEEQEKSLEKGPTISFSEKNFQKVKQNQTIKIKDVATQKEKEIDIEDLKKIQENKREKIFFEDIEGKMLLVRVGNSQDAATDDNIKDVETKLNELVDNLGIKCLLFVTHHAVDIQIIR